MTDTTAETAAQALNGTAPDPPAAGPCADCVTSGEKALAVVAALFGLFIIVMAFDIFSGGKVTGLIQERAGD